SRIMDRLGRRPGLAAAYCAAVAGAVLVVVAGTVHSFGLALAGLFLFGAGTTANLQARYAAADLALPERRATALSTVVWATTAGAVAGPNLAGPAGDLAARHGIPALAGPFAVSAVMFGLAGLITVVFLRPDPLLLARSVLDGGLSVVRPRASVRSALGVIRSSPGALLGLGAVAAGQSVMVGIMSMTPVHMQHGGAPLRIVGFVISVHVAGMYALSPVAGWLSDRYGRRPVILAGALLQLAACAVAGTAGEDPIQLGAALTLLGLGWSATLVAGSTLLGESVPVADRPSVQGTADFVMGLAGACAALLAGVVIGAGSYALLSILGAIAVLPLLAAAARRPAPAGATG
ncbi:MAG: major facilitator superfamily 1, partial [Actinomycetia bacterium]|nr:major facilitator superfamily 1 [Actinomycetes bacterium]